jgi:hypothetical protein
MLELGFFSEVSFRIICEIIGTFIYSLFVDDVGGGKHTIFCILFISILLMFFFWWISIFDFLRIKKHKRTENEVSKNAKKLTRKQRKNRKNQ